MGREAVAHSGPRHGREIGYGRVESPIFTARRRNYGGRFRGRENGMEKERVRKEVKPYPKF